MNQWTHFVSCWLRDAQLWVHWQLPSMVTSRTESVAKNYLSRWKTERNQLKRMQITSDISANTKEIFIYGMNAWAGTVWFGCPLWQLGLHEGRFILHCYESILNGFCLIIKYHCFWFGFCFYGCPYKQCLQELTVLCWHLYYVHVLYYMEV